MRLINVEAFLDREELIRKSQRVDRRTKVLEFRNDEATDYAILSHRWIEQEVNYDEMVELPKMEREERDEIRQRDGYRKILNCCKQAKRDGYEWLWVDTCCIDQRSSAELSEAINSMYRWYENSRVCYAWLHDVASSSFPTKSDDSRYRKFNGWPEWFSRGWTLQEMIAPSNVQFFSKDWRCIGDKKMLARTLAGITRVPQHVLTDGLSSNRPCVAQIMSWAADRTTTRVEDRAYSLLGLLDVNMPMLYGEGTKAFHRLQLELIRMSNDQSIFAWGLDSENVRIGSTLADDPSFFRGCAKMELMDPDDFVRRLKDDIPKEELRSIEEDRFGTFPITNRGIQIWLLLRPCVGSRSVFQASLPCRLGPSGPPVTINLALWKSNYYRYFATPWDGFPVGRILQFRQVYLRYQGAPHRAATFEIDDSAIPENGLTYCGAYPPTLTGNTLILTSTDPLCVRVYSDSRMNCRFAVGFGQCFGQDWIHFVCEVPAGGYGWETYAREEYRKMLAGGQEHAQSMAEARSRCQRYRHVCVKHTRLGSTWTVRTSCAVWDSSRNTGVKIEVFRHPGFRNGPDEWTGFRVDRTNDPNRDMRGLMLRDCPWGSRYNLLVDGVSMEFSPAPNGIKLGDYGHFTDFKDFHCEGNIFADLESLISKADTTPRQHKIDERHGKNIDSDYVQAHHVNRFDGSPVTLHKPFGLSLPSNHHFNSLLTSLSTRLANKYLVIRVIQCATDHSSELNRQLSGHTISIRSSGSDTRSSRITTPLCTIAKPLVWQREASVFGEFL